MHSEKLLAAELRLFDGGAAAPGETDGMSGDAGRTDAGEGGAETKAAGNTPPDAGEIKDTEAENEAEKGDKPGEAGPEELRREFRALVAGKYKDAYARETQRLIDRRFRDLKRMETELESSRRVMRALAGHYGLKSADPAGIERALDRDEELWRREAEKAVQDRAGVRPDGFDRPVGVDGGDARRFARGDLRVGRVDAPGEGPALGFDAVERAALAEAGRGVGLVDLVEQRRVRHAGGDRFRIYLTYKSLAKFTAMGLVGET